MRTAHGEHGTSGVQINSVRSVVRGERSMRDSGRNKRASAASRSIPRTGEYPHNIHVDCPVVRESNSHDDRARKGLRQYSPNEI